MLVWNAMPSITPMMSAILFDDSLMPFIVSTICATTSPPLACRHRDPGRQVASRHRMGNRRGVARLAADRRPDRFASPPPECQQRDGREREDEQLHPTQVRLGGAQRGHCGVCERSRHLDGLVDAGMLLSEEMRLQPIGRVLIPEGDPLAILLWRRSLRLTGCTRDLMH
jgi:hypothetical protein